MPVNYASVEANASRYAQQAQDWLVESRKTANQLERLFCQACSDPQRLRQIISTWRKKTCPNFIWPKPLQEDPLVGFPSAGVLPVSTLC